jgi:hypothetical protein
MRYAQHTEVTSDRSRSEIERTLARYGATTFIYGWDDNHNKALISFKMRDRFYKMVVPLPDKKDFSRTPDRGFLRKPEAVQSAWEQATRQRWRALALWIKAVLEAQESGIITLEEALLPFTMLPDGRTVGEWMEPQVAQVYQNGKMPPLLPFLGEK